MKIKSFGWLLAFALIAIAGPAANARPRGPQLGIVVADGPSIPPPGGGGFVGDGPSIPPPGGIVADGPSIPPPGGGGGGIA